MVFAFAVTIAVECATFGSFGYDVDTISGTVTTADTVSIPIKSEVFCVRVSIRFVPSRYRGSVVPCPEPPVADIVPRNVRNVANTFSVAVAVNIKAIVAVVAHEASLVGWFFVHLSGLDNRSAILAVDDFSHVVG